MTVYEIPYYLGQREQFLKPLTLSYQRYMLLKRAFDIFVCIFLLPFLLLPMVAISLAILLDSSGSPIFTQTRIGHKGTRFKIYKFRTLHNNHDGSGHRAYMQAFVRGKKRNVDDNHRQVAKHKPIQANEVTRIGRLLRKASLDELPQIINVLNGEMSLIGPRPNVVFEVEAYRPWHHDRLNALPGITGLAQVMGRSDISFDAIVRYDIQYIKSQALHFDFWILWKTVTSVLQGEGAG
ncbi:MAG: sugar transferase [Anaerolineae bacterium]|nr:sugar transferase [Anaerolineae bacterium]